MFSPKILWCKKLNISFNSLRILIRPQQFASVPNRADPGQGEINYKHLFQWIESLGYQRPLGAEYKPTTTIASLQ